MWLLILLFSAVISTALWYVKAEEDKYMLKFLSLILWGASIMVFIDHLIGYLLEGGYFIEISIESTVLGIVLVISALIIWEIALLVKDPKKVIHRRSIKT
ncbi:MAG: hypothetical protein NZ929_03060 [Aigarchaeota archaeon]|nr:hypothetical protein [Aigarchaeota archaeon]MCX8192596.1 hypothetical protein [Nitrososphaeria archaeon]MDW7985668.1 hypothetical protein [Nitrososphaerota archaeon]